MQNFFRIAQFFKSQKAAARGCYGIGDFLPDVISGNSDRCLSLRPTAQKNCPFCICLLKL